MDNTARERGTPVPLPKPSEVFRVDHTTGFLAMKKEMPQGYINDMLRRQKQNPERNLTQAEPALSERGKIVLGGITEHFDPERIAFAIAGIENRVNPSSTQIEHIIYYPHVKNGVITEVSPLRLTPLQITELKYLCSARLVNNQDLERTAVPISIPRFEKCFPVINGQLRVSLKERDSVRGATMHAKKEPQKDYTKLAAKHKPFLVDDNDKRRNAAYQEPRIKFDGFKGWPNIGTESINVDDFLMASLTAISIKNHGFRVLIPRIESATNPNKQDRVISVTPVYLTEKQYQTALQICKDVRTDPKKLI